jgi:hypothetical protein
MERRLRWRAAIFAGGIVMAQGLWAQGAHGITVEVNGQAVSFANAQPQMVADHVMVPLRGVLEQLGANVSWDQQTRTITASGNGTNITLRIGDSTASVNGQNVQLDQPAVVRNDTTLVPLRFMSETFGANVQWDASSMTVEIQTANAQSQPATPEPLPNAESVQTTAALTNASSQSQPLKLTDDSNGWIVGGKTINFTLTGSPGGQAVLVVPGIAGEIPMKETSPGQYTASWTPDSGSSVAVYEGSAVAKLTLNANTYYSPTLNNVNVDTVPPTIMAINPPADSVISGFMPEISAKLTDDGSGVDPSAVNLKLNGQDVTAQAKITQAGILYELPASLSPGTYNVVLTVPDKAGNTSSKQWSFSVTGTSITSDFIHTGRDTLTPGSPINFTLKAPPGSQVTAFIGQGREVQLSETSPGVFTGQYVVKPHDWFKGEAVTARIVPPGGNPYMIRAGERMGISANLPASAMIPVISSPLATQTVADPLVVSGTAPATSTVLVHVSYVAHLGQNTEVHGSVADIAVDADTAGNFQTPPIHIKHWTEQGDITYHISATVVMPDGTKSAATEMTIHQAP